MPPPASAYAPYGPATGPAPAPPGPMRLDGAVERAFEVVKAFCFAPFDLGKWFAFGFVVFLADLGEGAPIPTPPLSGFGGGGGKSKGSLENLVQGIDNVVTVVRGHAGLALGFAVGAAALGAGLSAVVLWLSARGTMMALRAVALNRTGVGEHWRATRESAWSYFEFRLVVFAIGLPLGFGGFAWAGWGAYRAAETGVTAPLDLLRAAGGGIAVLAGLWLVTVPVVFVGRNILAPLLLMHGGGLGAGCSRTMDVLRTSFGTVLLFGLFRAVVAMVIVSAEIVVVLATCCIGAIWVVHQTLCAPLLVFDRAFTLCAIGSMGPDYLVVSGTDQDPPPYAGFVPDPSAEHTYPLR